MQADDFNLASVITVLKHKTGMNIRTVNQMDVLAAIHARMKKCDTRDSGEYLRLLEGDGDNSADELRELQTQLTVCETYFFRDKGQFLLLEMKILPEIIKRHGKDKCIRVLSAGCSTGAEPYSVAMLLCRLLPRGEEWKVKIIGVDINEEALADARRAIYNEWTLRSTSEAFLLEFFQKKETEWHLSGAIREMVTFQRTDVSRENLPDYPNGLYDFDLILCRNLFIYYHSDKVRKMTVNLTKAIVEGGYLMTGHGELLGGDASPLISRSYPQSVIYQKINMAASVMPVECLPVPVIDAVNVQNDRPAVPHAMPETLSGVSRGEAAISGFQKASFLLKEGRNREAADAASMTLAADPENAGLLMVLGEAQANMGVYESASETLGKAASLDIHSPLPHWLLAHVEEALGDMPSAIRHYEKSIYCDSLFIPAYLKLAALHEHTGDFARADKAREAALNLLKSMPPEKLIGPYEYVTAGELAWIVGKTKE